MKKLLSIIILLVKMIQVTAQSDLAKSQCLLQGKYHLNVINKTENIGSTFILNNNLPGIYQILISFELSDQHGQKKLVSLNKQAVGDQFLLYQSNNVYQELNIQSMVISYNQFGESYRLVWTNDGTSIYFSKQGIDYSYANPFILCSTRFKWSIDKSNTTVPAENIKLLQVSSGTLQQ